MLSKEENIETMQQIFRAVECRDDQRMRELCQPGVEFHWPDSLPYGGVSRGLQPSRPTWAQTWDPLQPTPVERKLSPRVVAANGDEVVVEWQQRGVIPNGDRFECPVLGLYELHDGKLARAQMFYFDTAALVRFLEKAEAMRPRKKVS